MIRLLALSALLVAMVGCGTKDSPSSSAPAKVKISDEDYKSLLSADDSTLARRAQAGELGVCTLVDAGWGANYQPPQELWSPYLQDKNLYYPQMSKDPSPETFGSAGYELRKAWERAFAI